MLRHHGRFPYSAISERQDFSWPEHRRLAVYVALNLEHFSYGDGLGAQLANSSQPDVLNYSWREYGNRVGAWRMLAMFEKLQMPISVLINSALYEHCPQLVNAFRNAGHDIIAHGYANAFSQHKMNVNEEKQMIVEVTNTIEKYDGKKPSGWLSPWIAQSDATLDILSELGYKYTLDWCHDDQPTWLQTKTGRPLLSIPYPQEINDVPAIIGRHIEAKTFADMIIDQFDEMLAQSNHQSLVMGIALHPYISGQPFRLRQLRRALEHIIEQREIIWLCTAGDIADIF